MRFRLLTLCLLTALAPPLIAFIWFNWQFLLIAGICLLLISIWFWGCLSIARFFGHLVASLMG